MHLNPLGVENYVQNILDEIWAVPLEQRPHLLAALRQATDRLLVAAQRKTAYELRAAKVPADQVALALGVERHCAAAWADEHAQRNGLPKVTSTRGPVPPITDYVQV